VVQVDPALGAVLRWGAGNGNRAVPRVFGVQTSGDRRGRRFASDRHRDAPVDHGVSGGFAAGRNRIVPRAMGSSEQTVPTSSGIPQEPLLLRDDVPGEHARTLGRVCVMVGGRRFRFRYLLAVARSNWGRR
jgi:hypothetical protein